MSQKLLVRGWVFNISLRRDHDGLWFLNKVLNLSLKYKNKRENELFNSSYFWHKAYRYDPNRSTGLSWDSNSHYWSTFEPAFFFSTSQGDNCPHNRLTVRVVARYIMELARLIYEPRYFIRVSFEVSSCIEKARVLSDEDAQHRNIASVQRCSARPFRAARFMVRAVSCNRESRWTIIRYNRDNEIVLRHVRALTGKNPSNAARRRRDVRPSLIQRVDLATLRSLILISARSFINPRSPPITGRRLRTKDSNEAKETSSVRRRRIRLARLLSRGISWVIAGDLPEPTAGISQISGLMAPSWRTRLLPRNISTPPPPSQPRERKIAQVPQKWHERNPRCV